MSTFLDKSIYHEFGEVKWLSCAESDCKNAVKKIWVVDKIESDDDLNTYKFNLFGFYINDFFNCQISNAYFCSKIWGVI